VFEVLLREAAGGTRAPDVTARVLARLSDEHGAAVEGAGRRRGGFLVGVVLGAAAMAAMAAMAAWLTRDGAPRRLVAWYVAEGCLAWTGHDGDATALGRERVLWPIREGDRLRTCADGAAVTDVEALGRLHMSRNTEIEVEKMEWKSFGGGASLGAVTVAVVVGAIRWAGGGEPVQAGTGERLEMRAQTPQLAAARVEELQDQVAKLQQELGAAHARARELEAAAARSVAANKEAVAQTEEKPPDLEHAVTYAGMEPALAEIDWDVTGTCMHEMTQKLEQLLATIEAGEEPSLEVIGEIQKLNSELVKQAGILVKANVPGTGPNGAFTNPIVAANQIHATLNKAGMALSAAQEDALRRISVLIEGEDDARRGALPKDGFQLDALLGEVALKDRFYRDARNLLTPEQRAALFPERLAGASANLFDTGLVWSQFARPVEVRDLTEFADHVATSMGERLGLSGDAEAQLRATVATWASRMPEDTLVPADGLSRAGLGKLGPVGDIAARQLELLRELDRSLSLTPEQKRKLRAAGPIYLPRKK